MKHSNRKITNNFWLHEFLTVNTNPKAFPINMEDVKDSDIVKIETILAPFSQDIRDWVNEQFKAENNGIEIGLEIICAYRSVRWEKMQGREGKGTHPLAIAIDFKPLNCKDDNMYMRVFYSIAAKLVTSDGGFACKYPTYKSGKISNYGFIHKDFRNGFARWNY